VAANWRTLASPHTSPLPSPLRCKSRQPCPPRRRLRAHLQLPSRAHSSPPCMPERRALFPAAVTYHRRTPTVPREGPALCQDCRSTGSGGPAIPARGRSERAARTSDTKTGLQRASAWGGRSIPQIRRAQNAFFSEKGSNARIWKADCSEGRFVPGWPESGGILVQILKSS